MVVEMYKNSFHLTTSGGNTYMGNSAHADQIMNMEIYQDRITEEQASMHSIDQTYCYNFDDNMVEVDVV